jgi:hypothetical protein
LINFEPMPLPPSSGHLGMDNGDNVAGEFVIGRGDMAVDREFVGMLRPVVDDVSHGTDPLAANQFFKESVSMPRIDQASPSLAPLISSIFHCPASRRRL